MSAYVQTNRIQPADNAALAALELIRRKEARKHTVELAKYTNQIYVADPMHELIGETLDRVIDGEIKRLMIFTAPQHGKSMLTSRYFPARWFGVRPDDPVILTSYGASLAETHSEAARDIVESTEYARLFPLVTTDKNSRSTSHWGIQGKRGEMLALGVGGPVTGHGALLGIVDDPYENWKQAQSETIRKSVSEWYKNTFRPRIWENGAIIIIMTRWHADDICGELLKSQGHKWHILRLPALAESQEERDLNDEYLGLGKGNPEPLGRSMVHITMDTHQIKHKAEECEHRTVVACDSIEIGDAVAPTRMSVAGLLEIKSDMDSIAWSSEYQGVPRPAEGTMFKRLWIEGEKKSHYINFHDLPKGLILVRYWDKAGTEGAGAETAGVLVALSQKYGLYYIIDAIFGQWSIGKRDEIIIDTARDDARQWGNIVDVWHEQEPGSSGKESAQATNRKLAKHPVHADRVTGDKVVRARPLASAMENNFYRIVHAPWNKLYIDRFIEFPNAKLKDLIDATSGAHNKLAKYPRKEKPRGALARVVRGRAI